MEIKHLQLAFYLLVPFLIPISSAQAEIKCWRNNDNVRECGQAVPPEHSQKRIEVINSKGITVKVIPAKDEMDEIRRQKELQKLADLKKAAKKRKDLILLQTYTTEKDIALARKQNVRAIEGIIELTNGNTKVIRQDLVELEKTAANYERNGELPPDDLLKDMENLKRQVNDNEEFIAKKKQAKEAINTRFDSDLKRFRELKGTKKAARKPANAAVKP